MELQDVGESSDARLVVLVGRYHEDALAELYRRHAGAVHGLAQRIVGDSAYAENLVQEVFLRLWNAPERFDPARGSVRSFLLTDTRGRSVDLVRSESARQHREVRAARITIAFGDDVEQEIVDLTVAEHVRDALAHLTNGERQAIELAYFGGYTYREVAVLLKEPEGTIKSRIRTGLRRLRDALGEDGMTGRWTDN